MRFTEIEEKAILDRSGLLQVIPPAVLDDLRARYSEPKRHYHDWNHALSVLSWVNHAVEEDVLPWMVGFSPLDLRLAALFHDAIYDASKGAPHNETASVALFQASGITKGLRTADVIMATAQHGKTKPEELPAPIALFLDCDIAHFGEMRWEIVRWNDDNVTREYEYYFPKEQVAAGRKKFLTDFLGDGRRIFMSDYFGERFGPQAHHNLQRLISEAP